MLVGRLSIAMLCVSAFAVQAKPLITSSEETAARLCIARDIAPMRLVGACDRALSEVGLTQNQRVELLIARADGLLWQDKIEESVTSYRDALSLDAGSVEAWNGLGWALWETDGDEAALEAFEASLAIGASVQGLGGKAATSRRAGLIDNIQARELLAAALAIDPDYVWAVREVAWSYFDDGLFNDSIREFDTALAIEPRDENALYGMGRSKLSAGDGEEALALFNQVLDINGGDFPSLVYRIIALRNLDRNAQALRFADRLIKAHPDRTSGYIERALSLVALGRRAEALETYRNAEAKLGTNNAILYWHADALTVDGRFEEALGVIDRGLALTGADHSDYLLKSYIALELEKYDMAKVAAERALQTGVNDPWAHYYIAITLVHDGAASEGIERFQSAMDLGLPKDRVGAFARELINAGKYVEAAQLRLIN